MLVTDKSHNLKANKALLDNHARFILKYKKQPNQYQIGQSAASFLFSYFVFFQEIFLYSS